MFALCKKLIDKGGIMEKHIEIMIFGTGMMATELMQYNLKPFVDLVYFLDNDEKKQGTIWCGHKVLSPDNIMNEQYDYVVVATISGVGEIIEQLISYGVLQNRIIIPSWENLEYTRGIIDVFFDIPKRSIKYEMNSINTKIDYIREALGRIEGRQILMNSDGIENSEFRVFSQWGEDGIIKWLTNNLNISRKVFVEFGVSNYAESNTRFLMVDQNWSGLVMDGSDDNIEFIRKDDIYWRYNIKAEKAFITAENINELLMNNGIMGDIGLLSIDIDGNDYWVWKAITVVNPAIVICEYNYRFGKDRAVTIPYAPQFRRQDAHYSCVYFGASLKALDKLAKEKGYSLVTVNSNANNAFFVRNDLLNDNVKGIDLDVIYREGQFREARDVNGKLSLRDKEYECEIIRSMPIINV